MQNSKAPCRCSFLLISLFIMIFFCCDVPNIGENKDNGDNKDNGKKNHDIECDKQFKFIETNFTPLDKTTADKLLLNLLHRIDSSNDFIKNIPDCGSN